MNTITEAQVHMPLWCVYDRDGMLLAAFPSWTAAAAYSERQQWGEEA